MLAGIKDQFEKLLLKNLPAGFVGGQGPVVRTSLWAGPGLLLGQLQSQIQGQLQGQLHLFSTFLTSSSAAKRRINETTELLGPPPPPSPFFFRTVSVELLEELGGMACAGMGMEWKGSGWLGRGAVSQGTLEGPEEARRRFEVLASGGPWAGRGGGGGPGLPADEVGLRRRGLTGTDGQRLPPTNVSLHETRVRSNERLGRAGHVAIASRSKEAHETLFDLEEGQESEVEVTLPRVETRALEGGGLLRLLRGGEVRAGLLELPSKVLYAEQRGPSALLLSSARPDPTSLWITHRIQIL